MIRRSVQLICADESRTKQEFVKECDIQNILKKFVKTGVLTHLAKYGGRYDELPSGLDFQAAMETVAEGSSAFESLPSQLRNRFHNDPREFLTFVQNPENLDELRELGLAVPASASEVVTPEAAAEPGPVSPAVEPPA